MSQTQNVIGLLQTLVSLANAVDPDSSEPSPEDDELASLSPMENSFMMLSMIASIVNKVDPSSQESSPYDDELRNDNGDFDRGEIVDEIALNYTEPKLVPIRSRRGIGYVREGCNVAQMDRENLKKLEDMVDEMLEIDSDDYGSVATSNTTDRAKFDFICRVEELMDRGVCDAFNLTKDETITLATNMNTLQSIVRTVGNIFGD